MLAENDMDPRMIARLVLEFRVDDHRYWKSDSEKSETECQMKTVGRTFGKRWRPNYRHFQKRRQKIPKDCVNSLP